MMFPTPGLSTVVPLPWEPAVRHAREALAREGFGVLTEIDMQATLAAKLGVPFRRYTILGACNPHLAHRAVSAAPEIGLLLPCNVIVYEDDHGQVVVSAFDPMVALQLGIQPEAVKEVAAEVHARLGRVIGELSQIRADTA